ncbi:myosin light chain 1/3, skeletal muscle isoform isoform X2 [Papilio machaon]|uniref:myosin light chain 1/3, skeletal muscle isoform isoform X2 n=1 Tax=Papilio machaon TaxID=76193 RepID=UPI001E6648EB|nr:myosin light chain 1/3, skeletal muscle isoform isoform X2 [Papilio machaon]
MPPKAAKGKEAKKEPPKLAMGPPPKPKKIPPPPACFSPEDLARFKEVFKAHDEDNIDKVKLPEIPIMLRKLGFNPKGSEIKLLYEKFLEDEFVDTVEYFEWLFMIEAKINMGDDFELAVTKAMATLGHDDEETGITDLELLKEELMSWGEPLLEIEFVDFIKVATKNKTFTPLDDQKTLAAMAMKKAQEEKEEEERKEAERLAKEEAKRQKLIQQGLILPD